VSTTAVVTVDIMAVTTVTTAVAVTVDIMAVTTVTTAVVVTVATAVGGNSLCLSS
jgi:hypothetical protein